jgi:hypothetical protein
MDSATQMLMDIIAHYHKRRIRVAVSGLPPALHQLCERARLFILLNAIPGGNISNVFGSMREAVVELERQSVATPDTPGLNRAVMDASQPFVDVPLRKDPQRNTQSSHRRERSNSLAIGVGNSGSGTNSGVHDDLLTPDDTTPLLATGVAPAVPFIGSAHNQSRGGNKLHTSTSSIHIRVKERSHAEGSKPIVSHTNVVLLEALGLPKPPTRTATTTNTPAITTATGTIPSTTTSSSLSSSSSVV